MHSYVMTFSTILPTVFLSVLRAQNGL